MQPDDLRLLDPGVGASREQCPSFKGVQWLAKIISLTAGAFEFHETFHVHVGFYVLRRAGLVQFVAQRQKRLGGSNHVRYQTNAMTMRLSTNAPAGMVAAEYAFRLERPMHFFLGPDESFIGDIAASVDAMLADTIAEWQQWVRGLAIPVEWQDVVIRCAITLKLCQHGKTGAIVAALTTSIPEHAGSQRNWDYRYCWIRDAHYTVQVLNRVGALDVPERYLAYLRNIVDEAQG